MMRGYSLRRLFLSVVMLLAVFVSAYSQRPEADTSALTGSGQKALSYSFISPNMRENLKLNEAIRLLNSREEIRLVNFIACLSRCLHLTQTVSRAVGSWSDGAEHSTIFRTFADEQMLRYEDARLGKLERQKSVLYFRHDSSGAGTLYILTMRRGRASLSSISRTLDRNGVEFRSLVPQPKRGTIIYVVDLKSELHNQIAVAAKELRARLIYIKGDGEFIGDDTDREKAQQVFAGLIKEFEDAHPQVARQCAK
jgi:hypothetical protein